MPEIRQQRGALLLFFHRNQLVAAAEKGDGGHAGHADAVEEGKVQGIGQKGKSLVQNELGAQGAGHGGQGSESEGDAKNSGSPGCGGSAAQALEAEGVGHRVGNPLNETLGQKGGDAGRVGEGQEQRGPHRGQHGGADAVGPDHGGPFPAVGDEPGTDQRTQSAQQVEGCGQAGNRVAGPELVAQGSLDNADIGHRGGQVDQHVGAEEKDAVPALHGGRQVSQFLLLGEFVGGIRGRSQWIGKVAYLKHPCFTPYQPPCRMGRRRA